MKTMLAIFKGSFINITTGGFLVMGEDEESYYSGNSLCKELVRRIKQKWENPDLRDKKFKITLEVEE